MSSNHSIKVCERNGWSLKCPFCADVIHYTHLSNWNVPTPFFYSNSSNDVLLRDSDCSRVNRLYKNKKKPSLADLEALWMDILSSAPPPVNGGEFTLWSNVKCPHCKAEMPYNNGVKDLNLRIHDSKIILIDGACVMNDSFHDSWVVKVKQSV